MFSSVRGERKHGEGGGRMRRGAAGVCGGGIEEEGMGRKRV